ncbi:MAG: glucose 1-dehydrogenase [Alphaproteobacteria bacterium]
MSLAGKTALVTGAGRGIGRAIALSLAEAGADIAVTDLDEATAGAVADEVEKLGRRGLALAADVGDVGAIERMVAGVVDGLGGIDILVNNAGVTRHGTFLDIGEADWDLMQKVNAKGVFFCTQKVAKQMIEQGRGGRIVNIASIAGKGFRHTSNPAYASTKGAVIAMTYIAASQFAPHDINVNAICPGVVETEMLQGIMSRRANELGTTVDDLLAAQRRQIPLGRGNEPGDIAALATFLAGPGARNISGQTINVDGGLIMQ